MFLKRASKGLLLLVLATVLLSNCKKGEADPSISLRTRNARLVGEWNFQSGSVSITYGGSKKTPYSQHYALTSSDVKMTETYQGGIPTIYVGFINSI